MKLQIPTTDAPALNVSSLIDMVFLLLVYFMVTASLVKSEGDLSIKLPGIVQQAVQVDMPDEQIIEVHATGRIFLNGREFGTLESHEVPDLVGTLSRYRLAADASRNKAMVTIWAEDEAKHQRVIDVMNGCADAGIENVTFTSSVE